MNFYSDIRIKPFDKNIPVIASRVIKSLHESGDQNYAIALPEMRHGERPLIGRFIRVFHNNQEDLEKLVDFIESKENISFYVSTKRVKKVPDDISQYHIYRQVKLKSSNNIEKEENQYIKQKSIEKRENDIKEIEKLPLIKTVSSSNKNPIRFSIRREVYDDKKQEINQKTNGYGLSTPTKVTPLPVFE